MCFFSVLRESQRNRRKCIQRSCLHFLRFLWLSRSTEKKVVWDRENAWNLDKILPRFWNSSTWIEDNIFLRDLTILHLLRIFLKEKSRSGLLDGPFKSHNNVPYFYVSFFYFTNIYLVCYSNITTGFKREPHFTGLGQWRLFLKTEKKWKKSQDFRCTLRLF